MNDPEDRADPLDYPPLFALGEDARSDDERDPLAWQRDIERFQAVDREALWNAAPPWWQESIDRDQMRQAVAVVLLVLLGMAIGGVLGVIAGAQACVSAI